MSDIDDKLREILTTLVQNTWDISGEGYNGEYTSLSHPGGKGYSEEEVLADVMKHLEDYHGGALPIAQIKQAFADESGLTKLMQDMTNLHANMKHDMLRLGLTPTPEKHERKTGQEFVDNLAKELSKLGGTGADLLLMTNVVLPAARRAAGLDT